MREEHCADHCDLWGKVLVIDTNVEYIKKKLDDIKLKNNENKNDFKWIFTTVIAISSIIYTIYK